MDRKMNRKERRAVRARARKGEPSCPECGKHGRVIVSADGKQRCFACQFKHAGIGVNSDPKHQDRMVDPRQVLNVRINECLVDAIRKMRLADSPADLNLLVQALGMLAASFAARIGKSKQAFVTEMEWHMGQVQRVLGVQDEAGMQHDYPVIVAPR